MISFKNRLAASVFLCGAATMALELTGSRILAPYLGTSTIVWTSLIGIILGFLSVGYWLGGRLADKKPEARVFSGLIFTAACLIGLIVFIHAPVLLWLQESMDDLRWATVAAAVILFGPASVFLGTVLPYSLRLATESVDTAGRTAGTLCALSTVGSIVGTFAAGFWLLSYFGNTQILVFLALTVAAASALAFSGGARVKAAAAVVFAGAAAWTNAFAQDVLGPDFIDANTPYNHVWIYDKYHEQTGRGVRMMRIANEHSSAMYLDSDELVFEYTKFYDVAGHFRPEIKNALMIGGAAYSYPKDFLAKRPGARMDVVEIDPGITELAKKHFRLKDDPRMRIFHEDGRTFLNRTRDKYDVIFVDAFKSIYSLPHQLATVEAVEKIEAALEPGGAALVNLISAMEGEEGLFFRAELATYKKVFKHVYVIPVTDPGKPAEVQNIMLVATNAEPKPKVYSTDPAYQIYLRNVHLDPIELDVAPLTDEFAPVEGFMMKLLGKKVRHGRNPVLERWEAYSAGK